jgi:uncharacterized OB-fold protein
VELMTETNVETRAGQERLKELGVVPIPESDALTEPYWAAAAREELRLMACAECGRFRHPPTESCGHCGSTAVTWKRLSGEGTVYSFIVDHRLMVPGFDEPYVVAQVNLVEIDDNTVRLVANIKGCEPSVVRVGMPVEVFFEERGDVRLPQFRPRSANHRDRPKKETN